MNPQEIQKLRFRRQYFLTPFQVSCPFLHNLHQIAENAFLYTHIDLKLTIETRGNRKIILLGDLFDFENTLYDNKKILSSLISCDFESFVIRLSRFCGRFVVIFIENGEINALTDAASSRKIYYYKHKEGICCASQPHILALVLNLQVTRDQSKLSFYASEAFVRLHNSNIGNTTIYDEIYQLLPNHYLNLTHYKITRYWPKEKIQNLPLKDLIPKCASMVKGYMESITNRYQVMLPVTGGKDSRLLLSSSSDVTERVYYYINKTSWLNNKSMDIVIPKKLLRSLNLDFHVLDPYYEIDNDFKKIYFENNPYASIEYLPIIYNYYLSFSDKVNLPGTFINLIENRYEANNREINGQLLAKLIRVENYNYALTYFSEWYAECKDICQKCNMDVLNLLYWEERMANWGTQLQVDKDIAQDEIIIYNSRLLMETMLMANSSDREKPDFKISMEIIKALWPETLNAPCNPDIKSTVLSVSKALGIMKPVKAFYYSFVSR